MRAAIDAGVFRKIIRGPELADVMVIGGDPRKERVRTHGPRANFGEVPHYGAMMVRTRRI